MSLIKQAEELEFVPKQQLIQMAQNPRGDYPPFLVISEIERRNRNEKSFKAQQAKADMPTTTVAEESIMEFAGRGIAPSEPMLMASGGITQMQAGGSTNIERELNRTLLEKKVANMSSREKEQYADKVRRQVAGKNLNPFRKLFEMQGFNEDGVYLGNLPSQGMGLSDIYNRASSGEIIYGSREKYLKQLDDKIKNLRNELKLNQMGMANGGITQMQVGGQTEQEILRNQFLQSQGITGNNSLAASFNPFGQQSEEVSEEQKGFLRQRYTKPDGSIDFGRAARDGFNVSTLALILFPEPITSAIGTGARGIAGLGSRLFESIRKRPMLGTRAAGFGALGIANVPDFSSDKSTDNKGITAQEQIAQESQNKLQQLLTNTATPTDTTDTDDRDRFLTIAQLGGVIGAARNPSELSAGLGQLAGNIQQQRRGEDMRQAELQLKQAQIAQVQSAIENLPIEQLNETYNAIIEGINAGQLDAEEYGPTLNSIVQRLMALQNIDLQDNTSILQETRVS